MKYQIIGVILILASVSLISAEGEQILDDTVFIDTEHAYISASPHTITESGYVEFTIFSKQFTGDIDVYWGFNKLSGYPTQADYWNGNKWVNIPNNYFKQSNFCFKENHLWYYVEDHTITANNEIRVRVWIETKFNTAGKYDFIVKPSHLTFNQSKENNVLFHLDPWWDNAFPYKKGVFINNTGGGALSHYQVKLNVTYDSNMQTDFDDVRFVDVANNTLLEYWIESKLDGNYSNIWINVSSLAAGVWNNNSVEMYFGNNAASKYSDGNGTFPFFDDFDNNVNKWTGDTGFLTISGSTGLFNAGAAVDRAIYSDVDVQIPFVIESYLRRPANVGNRVTRFGARLSNSTDHIHLYHDWALNNNTRFKKDGGARIDHVTNLSLVVDEKERIVAESSSSVRWYFNDTEGLNSPYTVTANIPTDPMPIMFSTYGGANFELYWVFARKYAIVEPTACISGNLSTTLIQYDSGVPVQNIIDIYGQVYAEDKNDTAWIAEGLINNATIIMDTDYSNSTGSFTVTDGWIDSITVYELAVDDIIVLYEGSTPVEIGLVKSTSYKFTTNIDAGGYSITIMSYINVTGVHGFVYEGTSGITNPLSDVNVYIFNSTWSDTTVTQTGGYYAFTNLTNSTYTLNFKKDRYEDVLYQYVTPKNGSMYYKVIYMQKSTGDYYSRHYCTFILKNMFGGRYANVASTVYEDNVVQDTGTTGYDGAVVFHLFEDVEYMITFINASQSVNEDITLYPKDNEYNIYVSEFSFIPENDSMYENVQWYYLREEVNLTHMWINFTYRNLDNKTSMIHYWINNSTDANLFYTNQSYPCSATGIYISNNLLEATNKSFLVHFSAIHPDYPSLANSGVQVIAGIMGKLIDLFFSEEWQYTVISICIIVFIAMLFGATNAAKGALLIVLVAWFFSFIEWLPSSIPGYASLVLASILVVMWNMRKSEVVHT